MIAKEETVGSNFDLIKWLIVFALIIGGLVANTFFADDVKLLYKVLAWLVLTGIVGFIAYHTAKGASLWALFRESQIELRKVIWPSNAETNQTTLVVSAVVIVTAIILWLIDWGIGQLAKLVIG